MLDGLPVAFQGYILARQFSDLVEMALQGRLEDTLYKRRLPATRDTCNNGHHIKRKLRIDAFQVVHAAASQQNAAIPSTAAFRDVNGFRAREVFDGVALRVFLQERFGLRRIRIFHNV